MKKGRIMYALLQEVTKRLEWLTFFSGADLDEQEKEIFAKAKTSDLELMEMLNKKLLVDNHVDE